MVNRYMHDSITDQDNSKYAIRWFTPNGNDPNDPINPGSPNMAGDWSSEQKIFWIANNPNCIYLAERAIIFMSVKGTIDTGGFGNGDPLVNGLKFYYYNGTNDVYIDGFGTSFIYTNADWAKQSFETSVQKYGSGNQTFCAEWSFNAEGGPIRMDPRDKLVMVMQDNLLERKIEEFTIKIGGKYLKGEIYPANPQPIIVYPS